MAELIEPQTLTERTYAVGVDIGQSIDPTAIAVIEQLVQVTPASWRNNHKGTRGTPRLNVRHLERLKLGTPYPEQVVHVCRMVQSDPLNQPGLLRGVYVDRTGIGRAIVEMFDRKRLPGLEAVTITSGQKAERKPDGWSVPKVELVGAVQAQLHNKTLKIAPTMADTAALTRELQDFRTAYTAAGNATFNAKSGAHDDLIIALALAIFGLGQRTRVCSMQV